EGGAGGGETSGRGGGRGGVRRECHVRRGQHRQRLAGDAPTLVPDQRVRLGLPRWAERRRLTTTGTDLCAMSLLSKTPLAATNQQALFGRPSPWCSLCPEIIPAVI